jgi:hypothetical protein
VCEGWHERFAETPDVLIGALRRRTSVPVLDLAAGGCEFVAMAGPCSAETAFQPMEAVR